MSKLLLPQVHGNDATLAQGNTDNRVRAFAFAVAWLGLLGERRDLMRIDERLCNCAEQHAAYLDSRTPEQIAALDDIPHAMHIGQGGSTANQRVRAAGYRLPLWHLDGNTVECCARDGHDPAEVAVSLAAHDEHHDPMLGIGFWEPSVVWGVGCAGNDYVCIVAPPEEDDAESS